MSHTAFVSGLSVGDAIEGSIVHIEDGNCLYVQLMPNKARLDEVYEAMSAYYKSGKGQLASSVVVGGYYVVQFVQDSEWYRAKVTKNNGSSFEVRNALCIIA